MPIPVDAIVTVPPYATFLEEVARHRLVSGFRLNTVMPLKETPREVLARLSKLGQPLWVDLKGRQLRVVTPAIPPFTEIKLSHKIKVNTPVDAYFSDGNERARVAAVDGDRLIMEDGPRRMVGPGESVNIIDPSLQIEGTLTETDKTYLAAMKDLGLTKVMLSYAESPEDAQEVRDLLPGAEVVLKIETQRGLEFAKRYGNQFGQLMVARGDLYVEVLHPHKIISTIRVAIKDNKDTILASRLFESLTWQPVPVSADITDAAYLLELGYRTFLLGDQVCMKRDSVIAALNLLEAIAQEME
ncbi:MAG: hypothetical protein HYZ25_13305 [Chloroflexi bacterium]|nr:hypothetical protein [Chloroflexota bacterium]